MKSRMTILLVAVAATAGLLGVFNISTTTAYEDEPATSTEQEIRQKNVCSGIAVCTNTAENLIDSGFLP
jgi:hypothetical protein